MMPTDLRHLIIRQLGKGPSTALSLAAGLMACGHLLTYRQIHEVLAGMVAQGLISRTDCGGVPVWHVRDDAVEPRPGQDEVFHP